MKFLSCRLLPTAVVGLILAAPSARADAIDRALVRNAADIAKAVKTLKAEYVAVLKFEVTIGDRKPTFDAGLANAQLAQKLENLLVLTYDKNDPVVVLTGASAKAPAGVTWRDPAGRAELAKMTGLTLAWNKEQNKLTPDAFVTGELRVSKDLSSAKVVLHGFTRDEPTKLRENLYTTPDQAVAGDRSAVPADRSLLSMVGASFAVVDRALDRPDADREAIKAALSGIGEKVNFTNTVAVSPVKLQILLNGQPVEPRADPAHPGTGRIGRNAGAGDELQFRLSNTASKKYAVLLAVNGKNTNGLNNDHLNSRPAKDHRLWVLGPNEEVTIPGFFTAKDGTFKPFKILGDAASEAEYAAMSDQFRGLITMHVFGEKNDAAAAAVPQAKPPTDKPVTTTPPPAATPKSSGGNEPAATAKANTEKAEKQKAEAELALLSLGLGGDALEEVKSAGTPEEAQKRLQHLTNTSTGGDRSLGLDPRAAERARGLIVESDSRKSAGPIEPVPFKLDPNFLTFVQIRYYGR